jgi:curved DNA-binding protein CbpA
MTLNFYELLSVPRDADTEQIRAAHRHAMTLLHPDKGGPNELSRKVNEARDTLCDPAARAAYDARLAGGVTGDRQAGEDDTRPPPGPQQQARSTPGADSACDNGAGPGAPGAGWGQQPGGGWGRADPWGDDDHTGTATGWGWEPAGEDPCPDWDPWVDWQASENHQRGQHDQQQSEQPRRREQPGPGVPSWWARVNPNAALSVSPPLARRARPTRIELFTIVWGVWALGGAITVGILLGNAVPAVVIVLLGIAAVPRAARCAMPALLRRALTIALRERRNRKLR